MNGNFINGEWTEGSGETFTSINPATGEVIWEGAAASGEDVQRAIAAARQAFSAWSATSFDDRVRFIESFTQQLEQHRDEMIELMSREIGRPLWDVAGEIGAMLKKGPISVEAHNERCRSIERDLAGAVCATRYRPHGVCAVYGPFNFPGHVPNGHIIPALLAGNTIVFKPSELTPLFARKLTELWQATGLPRGVINMVQGSCDTGEALADPDLIDGLFFTGSYIVGRLLNRRFADAPGRIIALELGGNNPLVVDDVDDLTAAAYMTVQSAFITSGQRCTCASRLIVPEGSAGDAFIDRLTEMTRSIVVGPCTQQPEPFMGPVIQPTAADHLLEAQSDLLANGATAVVEMSRVDSPGGAMLTPAIIDVTAMPKRSDHELFGPVLQLIRVPDLDAAIDVANDTRYGLSAALLSNDRAKFDLFYSRIRAGVVGWNRPTTGASSYNPFGGVGRSGNHRPAGYHAADYCSWPVASLERSGLALPESISPGIEV